MNTTSCAAGSTADILAVRYGTRQTSYSEVFHNFGVYDEPDSRVDMDYFFWIIRSDDEIILVDTGFNYSSGEKRGRTMLVHPVDAIRRLGFQEDAIDRVILTHCHYDHIGNLNLFPNATFIIHEDEYSFWRSPVSTRTQFATVAEQADLMELERADEQGRLERFHGPKSLGQNIRLFNVPGHTPGQTCVLIDGPKPVILAADAVHYYEEMERDRPFSIFSDLAQMYLGFDRLRRMMSAHNADMIAGHDPRVMESFQPIDAQQPGLGVQVSTAPRRDGQGAAMKVGPACVDVMNR